MPGQVHGVVKYPQHQDPLLVGMGLKEQEVATRPPPAANMEQAHPASGVKGPSQWVVWSCS